MEKHDSVSALRVGATVYHTANYTTVTHRFRVFREDAGNDETVINNSGTNQIEQVLVARLWRIRCSIAFIRSILVVDGRSWVPRSAQVRSAATLGTSVPGIVVLNATLQSSRGGHGIMSFLRSWDRGIVRSWVSPWYSSEVSEASGDLHGAE